MVSVHTTQTPATPDDTDSAQYTLGMSFYSDVAGTISNLKYRRGSNQSLWDNRTILIGLWTSNGALVASGSRQQTSADPVNSWIAVPLATSVSISAATTYRVGYLTPVAAGHYVYTSGGLSAGINNSPLHGVASFQKNAVTALTFPDVSSNGIDWFVDIDFTPAATGSAGALTAAIAVSSSATKMKASSAALGVGVGVSVAANKVGSTGGALACGLAMTASVTRLTAASGALTAGNALVGVSSKGVRSAGVFNTGLTLSGAGSTPDAATALLGADLRLTATGSKLVAAHGALVAAVDLAGAATGSGRVTHYQPTITSPSDDGITHPIDGITSPQ